MSTTHEISVYAQPERLKNLDWQTIPIHQSSNSDPIGEAQPSARLRSSGLGRVLAAVRRPPFLKRFRPRTHTVDIANEVFQKHSSQLSVLSNSEIAHITHRAFRTSQLSASDNQNRATYDEIFVLGKISKLFQHLAILQS